MTSLAEEAVVDMVVVLGGEVVVIVCQDGRAVLAHLWRVVAQKECLLGDHEHLQQQVDAHPLGRPQICPEPELPHGLMVHELSTLTTATVLLMALEDVHPPGRPVEGLLLLAMLSVLAHVRLHMAVVVTAGAQDPRLPLGEYLRQLLELVETTHGEVQALTTPLRPVLVLVPRLLVH